MKSFIVPVLFLALFSLLAFTRNHFDELNNAILQKFATPQTRFFTDLAIAFADIGNTNGMIILTALAVGVFVLLRRTRDGLMLAVIMILGSSLNAWLKTIFVDLRPEVFQSPYPAGGYSFPSGHSQAAVGLYGTLALLSRRWFIVIPCVAMIFGIGWCRVYLGVHRLTDVLAGMTLACFVIATVCQSSRYLSRFSRPPAGGGGVFV